MPLNAKKANERKADGGSTEEKIQEQDDLDDWDNDPDNARNWSLGKKWVAVAIVSFYTFIPPLCSSMMAPGLPEIAIRYDITNATVVALTLSIFLLSFAITPLVFGPLSEMYGRTWVLHIANLLTLVFNLACGFSPSVGALIAFRFLAGAVGAAPLAIGGGSIGDLFSERDRALAMAVYVIGPLIGPAVGPVAGGFIAQSIGVKYIFVVLAGAGALASIAGIPFLRETYAPIIQIRKLKKCKSDSEKAAAKLDILLESNKNKWQDLRDNLVRPIVLLTQSFVCFILSLYMAFLYGIYYLMFSTFANFFSTTYGFGPGIDGLTYLGLGVGFLIAMGFGARTADKMYKRLADKNGGVGTPEMRMPAMIVASFTVPIGLFWYGWSAQAKLHWIMPIIGSGIFGFGMLSTYLPVQLYLVDAFKYAASATSAASVLRSLLGFAFPLFGSQMYKVMGLGGGNSLLAGLAIVLGIPFPIWIYYKGAAMRARSSLTK
ncbi:hypothetical protein AX14_008314 [Amanita brunnescens Koide BX004]|nr:hypothetical protein AX14_008314 [Amanita brunnescens Koide BX004]